MRGFNFLVAVIAIGFLVICGVSPAAVTTSQRGNVVHMTETGDSSGKIRCVIKSVKVLPRATGKYYELRDGTTTGALLWQHGSYASSLANAIPETVKIDVGTSETVFVTDDSTGSVTLEY